jgi:cell division protein FtsB
MRAMWVILILALIGLQYKLWLGDGNVKEWMALQQKNQEQDALNEKLRARNLALSADIKELKSGDQALEEKARTDLGMVKSDEIFYRLVE